MRNVFRDLFRRERPRVGSDNEAIALRDAVGGVTRLRLDELRQIVVVTTDDGPLGDDLFWVLFGERHTLVVPSETPGVDEMLERLQALPGFDHDAVISAACSVDNAQFLVWVKPEGSVAVATGGLQAT